MATLLVAAAGDRAWERRTDAVVARRRRRRTDAVEDRDRRWWDVRRRRRAEVEEEQRRRRPGGGRLELIFRTEYLTNISTDSHVEPANICSYSRDRVERSLCYDGMMYEYL